MTPENMSGSLNKIYSNMSWTLYKTDEAIIDDDEKLPNIKKVFSMLNNSIPFIKNAISQLGNPLKDQNYEGAQGGFVGISSTLDKSKELLDPILLDVRKNAKTEQTLVNNLLLKTLNSADSYLCEAIRFLGYASEEEKQILNKKKITAEIDSGLVSEITSMFEHVNFNLVFPNLQNEMKTIPLIEGSVLFVLGANGTGKSSLMHYLYSGNRNNAKRISAHRQSYFTSNMIKITSHDKRQKEIDMLNFDTEKRSRYTDRFSGVRSQIAIFDLIDAEKTRAIKITAALDSNQNERVNELKSTDAPLKILNRLLKTSNLPIEISIERNEALYASKNGSALYSIAELSDGERNAILIVAGVLTAKQNSLLIIDEPDRHLHKSIISPLLTALFRERSDCTFVIATHDINLPLDNFNANVLLVRGCNWNENNIVGWDTDLASVNEILSAGKISSQIKQDILGAQRILLFVEGDNNGLDIHIYRILFPEATVIAQGSCIDVERAVYGISTTSSLHWVKAIGLVDADSRTKNKIEQLKSKNIYALPCYSVESIYYSLESIKMMAKKSAKLHGDTIFNLEKNAHNSLIDAVVCHKDRLCARLCVRKVEQQFTSPSWKIIRDKPNCNIKLNIPTGFDDEVKRFDNYVKKHNIESIISRYPIRETQALDEIARSLKFPTRKDYENAVRVALLGDEKFRIQIRKKFGELVQAIERNEDKKN